MSIFRKRHEGCSYKDTYKYYVSGDRVEAVWRELAERFGPMQHGEVLPIIEINGESLWLRATSIGTPITVIRKRGWTGDELCRLHAILGFREDVSYDE